MKFLSIAAFAAAVAVWTGPSWSQEAWPSKPVRLVVPSSPGGGTDVFARLLAQTLTDAVKQQFIVENKPGASGNIGAQTVATAPRDGYTFLVAANASTAINLWLHKNLTFDVRRDLVPVSRGVYAISVLVVNADLDAANVAEFVALAKKRPNELAFGSAGTGSSPYLGVRMLEEVAGLEFVHAPYKGVGPAYQDLIAGRLQFMYTDLASALPHVKAGKLKALAVDRKTILLPQTPTFAEAGLAKFDAPISFSILAPSGVPQPIIQRMSTEVRNALKTLAPRLEQQALIPVYDTPAEFMTSLDKERANWGAFIQRNGITAEQ